MQMFLVHQAAQFLILAVQIQGMTEGLHQTMTMTIIVIVNVVQVMPILTGTILLIRVPTTRKVILLVKLLTTGKVTLLVKLLTTEKVVLLVKTITGVKIIPRKVATKERTFIVRLISAEVAEKCLVTQIHYLVIREIKLELVIVHIRIEIIIILVGESFVISMKPMGMNTMLFRIQKERLTSVLSVGRLCAQNVVL